MNKLEKKEKPRWNRQPQQIGRSMCNTEASKMTLSSLLESKHGKTAGREHWFRGPACSGAGVPGHVAGDRRVLFGGLLPLQASLSSLTVDLPSLFLCRSKPCPVPVSLKRS